ncbi:unnamed protein product [Schistocephalus solidus]|uniref:Uncharacterized protein n=1 Tax=Schistocephalus solidus TaxID=70667 RepID=A0A183T5V6_SCHSO|nr:unnamed protein product [Schistocephalus solidus]
MESSQVQEQVSHVVDESLPMLAEIALQKLQGTRCLLSPHWENKESLGMSAVTKLVGGTQSFEAELLAVIIFSIAGRLPHQERPHKEIITNFLRASPKVLKNLTRRINRDGGLIHVMNMRKTGRCTDRFSRTPAEEAQSQREVVEMSREHPRLAAPLQLHLPQHGVDAEDFGPLKDFRVRDPVLPSQLQYSAEPAEMKVIQLPGLFQVDGPGLRSVKECRQDDGLECRQDDGLVHLQFGIQVNTVAIPHGGLQPAEGLTSFGDPLGNLVIDSRVARNRASWISEGFHLFELSTVDIDSRSIVFRVGWRLVHENRSCCTDY